MLCGVNLTSTMEKVDVKMTPHLNRAIDTLLYSIVARFHKGKGVAQGSLAPQ